MRNGAEPRHQLFALDYEIAPQRPLHFSHAVYAIAREDEGPCIIEPSVPCTHCDYCKSHGH